MNTYIKSLLALSVVSGIINAVMSGQSKLKKYLSYLTSLIMISILITPLFWLISSFDKIEEYISNLSNNIKTEEIIENSNSLIIKAGEESICNGIKNLVITKFGFEDTDVYVYLDCDKSNIDAVKINLVNVVLTNKASWSNTNDVEEYLTSTVGCKITVTRR